MNGQLNSSLATENAAFAKIKALSKKVDSLEQDTIANKDEIDALDNELSELSSKQNYSIDTLNAKSIDVSSSAVVNSLTSKGTITTENVDVNNTLNVNNANITNLSSVNTIDAVNVNADKITGNNITCVEGFTSNVNNVVEENVTTLNVNDTSNLTGQVNVAGNMTFTKDSGNSVLAGEYLEVQAMKVVPDNIHFDPDKTGPEELPSITGRVAIDGVTFENTTPQMSVTDFAASDANVTNATIDDAIVKNITVTEKLSLAGTDAKFEGIVDITNLSFDGVESSGEIATTALGIDGDGHLVINEIVGGGGAGDVATQVQNTKFYSTNYYNGGQPAIKLDTSFAQFSLPTYITMLKLWEQQYDGKYGVDFYRWHEFDLDNEGLKVSSIDSDGEMENQRNWSVLRQLLLDKDSASLFAKREDKNDDDTNYESSVTVNEDKVELKRTSGVYSGGDLQGQPVEKGSLTLDNNGITLNSGNIYLQASPLSGDTSCAVEALGDRLYLKGTLVEVNLTDFNIPEKNLYLIPTQNELRIASSDNTTIDAGTNDLNIKAGKVTVNGGQLIHGVWFDKVLTDDNFKDYLANVTEDEETIYLDMTKQLESGYVVLKNKTIYAKEWWLLKDEYPNDEYMPEIPSTVIPKLSRIANLCLSNCTVIGCRVIFTTSPDEGKWCLDKNCKFIDCYVNKENWTYGLVDTTAGVGQLIENPEEFPIFEHSNLRLDYASSNVTSSMGFLNSKNSQFNLDMEVYTLTFTKDGNNVYKIKNTHPTVENKLNFPVPSGGYERQE